MYHALGKEEYDKLPGLFTNSDLAKTLDGDQEWWCYTYMFPHNTRDLTCTVDMLIKFRKSDGMFWKVYSPQ